MAKIYETRDDFVRDKLTEQASDLRTRAHQQESVGFTLMAGSLVADVWNLSRKTASSALNWVGAVLAIAAVVEWIQSWRTGSKAHDLELQRERMGPQKVVVMDGDASLPGKECKPCNSKSFAGGYKARKPTDFAVKPDDHSLPPH